MSDYYDSGYDSSSASVEDTFDPYEVATNGQGAAAEIADRIEQMQRLFKEAVMLANEFGLDVVVDLDLPDSAKGGHNHDHYVYWNSSSKYC